MAIKEFKVKIEGLGQNDPVQIGGPTEELQVRFSVYRDDIRFFDGILLCLKENIDNDEIEEMVRAKAAAMIEARPLTAKIIDEIKIEVNI